MLRCRRKERLVPTVEAGRPVVTRDDGNDFSSVLGRTSKAYARSGEILFIRGYHGFIGDALLLLILAPAR